MPRWKTVTMAVVILLMACCGYIFAQTKPSSPPKGEATDKDPRMEQAIDYMFREMDSDHDGKISKSEWMAFQEKQYNNLDKDGHGFLTKDDVRARMKEEQERRQKSGAP